jgi:hypothetical protein
MRRVGSWLAAVALFLPLAISTAAAMRTSGLLGASAEPRMACCRNNKNCCCRRNRGVAPKITAASQCEAPCRGILLSPAGGQVAVLRGVVAMEAPSSASTFAWSEQHPTSALQKGNGGARSPPQFS